MPPEKLKILIIAKAFPPQNAIGAHRPYSWAKYWYRAGHDVTVLTVPKILGPQDLLRFADGFRVIEIPIPLWNNLLTIFSSKSHSTPASPSDSVNTKRDIFKSIKDMAYRTMVTFLNRYGIFSGCRMPDVTDLWGHVAFQAVCHQEWDLVVSTAWPYGVHRPAYRLKKNGMAKYWITDWRDLWTDNHMYPGLPGFRSIEKMLEKRWSSAADAITTVSNPLAEILRKKYGDKVHVIYNGFDAEEYHNLPKTNIFPADHMFRIVYTGSMYKGQRDPSALFIAIRKLHQQNRITPDQLKIIFCGSNSDVSVLARENFVEDFVEYVGFVPRQQALQMQRDADALLFLEFESEKVKGILTGKLFEYLFAGPPILGVGVDDDSSVGGILSKTGRGRCFGTNIDEITKELLQLMTDKNQESSCNTHPPNRTEISVFSRKAQSEKMLNILKLTD